MGAEELIKQARTASGRTQMDVARRSGTSRPTLSAYERGRKSPTLTTAAKILAATGHRLAIEPCVEFTDHLGADGRVFAVPDRLPRLPVALALAKVALAGPPEAWPARDYDLADRADRRLVYAHVLTRGRPDDILRYVDGALLIDLWPELDLPPEVRDRWAALVAETGHGERVPT